MCCSRASWPRCLPPNAGLSRIAPTAASVSCLWTIGSLCILPLDHRLEPLPSVCFRPLIGTTPLLPARLGPPLIIVASHRRQIRMDQCRTSNELHYRPPPQSPPAPARGRAG